ncbi:unnamed protein product [Larinioides sclopetarius]|uniref:Uncharacterized protein n=1 Tax=Larinioides sclopetarius TaxID=280406 RepID=A0AAV2BG93_9ARAC
MEIINNSIRDRAVELCTSLDIAQYSFIVQNSLTPLNLELCQSYNVSDGQQNNNYPSFSFSKEFISTEEKCRKVLTKSRSVLYSLHLDLPRNRERSLKVNSEHMELSRDWKIPTVAKIHIRDDFYDEIMYSLMHEACKGKNNNLKVLKWFIKFGPLERSLFYQLPCSIINYFLDSMHPELNDCEYVIECLRKIDVIKWLINGGSSKPGRFTNLLYQIHRNGRNVKCSCCIDEVIDFCISLSSVQITEAVLKLKSAPSFCEKLFYFYVEEIFHERLDPANREQTTATQSPRLL